MSDFGKWRFGIFTFINFQLQRESATRPLFN
jgi:hypothetical protein